MTLVVWAGYLSHLFHQNYHSRYRVVCGRSVWCVWDDRTRWAVPPPSSSTLQHTTDPPQRKCPGSLSTSFVRLPNRNVHVVGKYISYCYVLLLEASRDCLQPLSSFIDLLAWCRHPKQKFHRRRWPSFDVCFIKGRLLLRRISPFFPILLLLRSKYPSFFYAVVDLATNSLE